MKQAFNKVHIEGILSEMKLEKKIHDNNRKFIAGELIIKVGDNNFVPVNMFSYDTTKEGKPNKIYQSLETIMAYKSIAEHGDAADKIRVDRGELISNDYMTPDGRLVTFFRIRSNFANRVTGLFTPKAEFQIETFIIKISDEMRNSELTGNKIIRGATVLYGDRLAVLDFAIDNEQAVRFVENNYTVKDTVKLAGEVFKGQEIKEILQESAFGDPIMDTRVITISKLTATSGTPPYNDGYDASEMLELLAARQQELDAMEKAPKTKEKSTKPSVDF